MPLGGARRWPSAAAGTDITCGRCSHSPLHVECHEDCEDAGDIGSRRQDSADAGRRDGVYADADDTITIRLQVRSVRRDDTAATQPVHVHLCNQEYRH